MCNINCIIFGAKNLTKEEIKGKRVLEVGAYDVNGSLRPLVESWEPSEYIGVDIEMGPGVDIICDAENLVEKFGEESFDIVISTELLEHVKNWKKVVSNIKRVCKRGGIILITTRSKGFPYHPFPYDFWRYELEDFKEIFSDLEILSLEKDNIKSPGVFIKARKPQNFKERDLSDYKLYSIITNKRMKEITEKDFYNFYFFKLSLKNKIKEFLKKLARYILGRF